jgi:hypothetical protein
MSKVKFANFEAFVLDYLQNQLKPVEEILDQ